MKKKGIGIASIAYPTGFYGGGDPNQAQISLKADGSFELMTGTVDIGQGAKTTFTLVAAEEMDVPVEAISFTNIDTSIAPFCLGAFASRATFIGGNAVIKACKDLKTKIKAFAAPMLESEPEKLTVADGKVFVTDQPDQSLAMADVGGASTFGAQFLVGLGAYAPGPGGMNEPDPETGEQSVVAAVAFATGIIEVEVDTGTGVVEVLKIIQVYEIGKAINPLGCKGQIHGGTAMGIGMALSEDAHPNWPDVDGAIDRLGDYAVATAADMPADECYEILEVPHPDGPFGAKGFSEMSGNLQVPAISAAIHDAVGVWISQYPASPEAILKALQEHDAG